VDHAPDVVQLRIVRAGVYQRRQDGQSFLIPALFA